MASTVRPEPGGGGKRPPKKVATQDAAAKEREYKATLLLQSVWRARKCRKLVMLSMRRRHPMGFYTHGLGLTYVSPNKDIMEKVPWAQWIYQVIDDPNSSSTAQGVSLFLFLTIALSIFGFALETVPEIHMAYPDLFFGLEIFCTVIFSVEYLSRFLVCTHIGMRRVDFIRAPLNVFDVLAISPFYVEGLLKLLGFQDSPALQVLRAFRVIRVVRIFKLARYFPGMTLTARALMNSTQAVSVLAFLLGTGMACFSSLVWGLEKISCPSIAESDRVVYEDECSLAYNAGFSPSFGLCCTADLTANDFPSIIPGCWWAVVTMTSVGYGDIYPRTTQGKVLGFLVMITGMIVIALPVAIVGQKFQAAYDSHRLDSAKVAGALRMEIKDSTCTLMPSSTTCSRLRHLKVKDPALSDAVVNMTICFLDVWEQREITSREANLATERHKEISTCMLKVLDKMGGHELLKEEKLVAVHVEKGAEE